MTGPVRLEIKGAVGWITLNRPDNANAIDLPLSCALLAAVNACDADAAVRCVVLTGAGRLFCGGGDVAAFAAAGDDVGQLIAAITANVNATVSRLMRMEKPLVTAINGPAAGAGLGLAVSGDIALAVPSANFTLGYCALGLSPDAGATWFLPRLIGMRCAQEMALVGRRLTADEAVAANLITRLVDQGRLEDEAHAVASTLEALPIGAIAATRALLLAGQSNTLETQLEVEARAIGRLSREPNGREGARAFSQRRKPAFL